jgi:hypothetical protein
VDVVSILLLLLLYFVGVAVFVSGTVDTFQFAPEAWLEAGYRRVQWVWQALGVLFFPAGLVYSGVYFIRVRRRVAAAQATLARQDPAYEEWVAGRGWYDRLIWARRSPDRWVRAARMWWVWGLYAVVAAGSGGVWAWAAASDSGRGHHSQSPWAYATLVLWGVTALVSAARAGFWYAEHMRLTGRRPSAGGRLVRHGERPHV